MLFIITCPNSPLANVKGTHISATLASKATVDAGYMAQMPRIYTSLEALTTTIALP